MTDLLQDITTLTSIGRYNLNSLVDKSVSIINHSVVETLKDNETVTTIDIGLGKLHIQHTDDSIKYKFIPSKKLDRAVCTAYRTKKSDLAVEIDEALGERIQNTYKDLF